MLLAEEAAQLCRAAAPHRYLWTTRRLCSHMFGVRRSRKGDMRGDMAGFARGHRRKLLKNNVKNQRNGSPGRIRTYDQSINSRLLYR